METKATGHSVSTLSSRCPLHCPCIVPRSGCEKEQCLHYPWQPIISGQPTQTEKLARFFFPSVFLFFLLLLLVFFLFFMLHCLFFVFVSQKRLIGRRDRKAAPNKCRYCWQHVTSKSVRVYLYMSVCMCVGVSDIHSVLRRVIQNDKVTVKDTWRYQLTADRKKYILSLQVPKQPPKLVTCNLTLTDTAKHSLSL